MLLRDAFMSAYELSLHSSLADHSLFCTDGQGTLAEGGGLLLILQRKDKLGIEGHVREGHHPLGRCCLSSQAVRRATHIVQGVCLLICRPAIHSMFESCGGHRTQLLKQSPGSQLGFASLKLLAVWLICSTPGWLEVVLSRC